jgi:adenine-specific DNA-methyltransferase
VSRAIDGLLGRITDTNLRAELAREVEVLRANKDFGLVFERHLPENVRLYGQTIRRGSNVQELTNVAGQVWVVRRIDGEVATLIDDDGAEVEKPLSELVVVSEFGEPIYPGFEVVDSLERGGDKPFHTVINGENFHVLEALAYVYEGQVDCIYIDPPYNTGARDWKYNNDYVDGEDAYRHSKWLSFMEKRLKIAKKLLNPEDSVLIVTIDEKEYLRLGLLLQQVFTGAAIQMVTSVISPKGSARQGEFSRCDEYIFFVCMGAAAPEPQESDMLFHRRTNKGDEVEWGRLTRNGANGRRAARPNLFYPIFFDSSGNYHSTGDIVPLEQSRSSVIVPEGLIAVFPTATDGRDMTWGLASEKFQLYVRDGFVKFGALRPNAPQPVRIYYLTDGYVAAAKRGEIKRVGGKWLHQRAKAKKPLTVWNMPSHNAAEGGTNLLKQIIPGRRFPFPKSLYAIEDALKFFVGSKQSALIIDFFGGSGTTAHAVARLNRQDGGRRRSIVVTNNEVSDEEASRLVELGSRPGQPKWEALGIFEYITMPRVKAAFSGLTPEGESIAGDYKFTEEFPMAEGFDENAIFLKLKYLEKNSVARGKAFESIAPLLWLKAGAKGPQITKVKKPFAVPKGAAYAVLFDTAQAAGFIKALRDREDIEHAYIVTNSMAEYQQVIAELPTTVETTMLYEDYISNFELNLGRLL